MIIISEKRIEYKIRLTKEEFEIVNSKIKNSGMTKQEFGKRALLGKNTNLSNKFEKENVGYKNKIRYVIRLTKEEFKKTQEKINKCGMTKQEFGRRALLNKEVVVIDLQGINELITQIRKIGVNINQIARVINETKAPNEGQLDSIIKLQRDIWDKLCSFLGTINSIKKV